MLSIPSSLFQPEDGALLSGFPVHPSHGVGSTECDLSFCFGESDFRLGGADRKCTYVKGSYYCSNFPPHSPYVACW